jgi:hypothetical protein
MTAAQLKDSSTDVLKADLVAKRDARKTATGSKKTVLTRSIKQIERQLGEREPSKPEPKTWRFTNVAALAEHIATEAINEGVTVEQVDTALITRIAGPIVDSGELKSHTKLTSPLWVKDVQRAMRKQLPDSAA